MKLFFDPNKIKELFKIHVIKTYLYQRSNDLRLSNRWNNSFSLDIDQLLNKTIINKSIYEGCLLSL